MKKLITDLKVSELIEICKKHHDDYCTYCPLLKFCESMLGIYLNEAFERCEGVIEV